MTTLNREFNLMPDPRVLVVLTQTPLRPLDALSELIDNSLDSFRHGELQGVKIDSPQIDIRIPTTTELRNGATVSITDTGPGMTAENLSNAVTAGFSSKSAYRDLGLFGVGLNIATGKLGQLTEIRTKTQNGDEIEVKLDLGEIQRNRNYIVPYTVTAGTESKRHHTTIEIKKWWPDGHPNSGFIRSLCNLPKDSVRKDIGRRYATILREKRVHIFVNGVPCIAYEPVRWASHRSVSHRVYGEIPAYYEFQNKLLSSSSRCTNCGAIRAGNTERCATCDKPDFETIEEKLTGWVGIQRYDDATDFGIDLIRNGRAIVIQECDAFFSYVNEVNKRVKEYPDGTFGRIIGEIHLDYAPVEFMKRDFERTSSEWANAIKFLRGETPLSPRSIEEGQTNSSPIFMLFQGYRKVRTGGRRELYMCKWDATKIVPGPERIDRSVEYEYRRKFDERRKGFYDDEEWYKLVEAGETAPQPDLILCSQCDAQNIPEAEECQSCGFILQGKACVACDVQIPKSAQSCPSCGESQIVIVQEPWKCSVCNLNNLVEADTCARCGSLRGTANPTSIDQLLASSTQTDKLSRPGVTTVLPGGQYTQPIDVKVYETNLAIKPTWNADPIPLMTVPSLDNLQIFLDVTHPMVKSFARPEHLVASEVAAFLSTRYNEFRISGDNYSVSALTWQILKAEWGDDLVDDPESVKADIRDLFERIRDGLKFVASDIAEDVYNNLIAEQQTALMRNLRAQNRELDDLLRMVKTGEFFSYVDNDTVVSTFRAYPGYFFDGKIWKDPFAEVPGLFPAMLLEHQQSLIAQYGNCLEDVCAFTKYSNPEAVIAQRARSSSDLLYRKLQ